VIRLRCKLWLTSGFPSRVPGEREGVDAKEGKREVVGRSITYRNGMGYEGLQESGFGRGGLGAGPVSDATREAITLA
jgi:hypothetical protein